MADDDKGRCKSGTMELAALRRADAEQKKVEELAKWRELVREIFEWWKAIFKSKE